jgi:prepilin signal peptidase PulO-like enzyme (type II secretory pathway)
MSLFWLIGVLVFALGAAIGSFLNVLVYRTQKGKDWVKGRSVCEHCGRLIPWYQNIPLFSYIFLRGKCANCGKRIGLIHPLIELLTGSLFLWWYIAGALVFRLTAAPMHLIQPLYWLLVGCLFVAILISDLKYFIIPRWAIVLLTGATLLYRLTLILTGGMQLADFAWSLVWTLILAGFFFLLFALTRGKGFGFGDVQLAIPLGMIMVSWQRILVGIFLAFLIGAAVGSVLLLTGKRKLRSPIPFGPFLLLGSTLGLLWGFEIWSWYAKIIGS